MYEQFFFQDYIPGRPEWNDRLKKNGVYIYWV